MVWPAVIGMLILFSISHAMGSNTCSYRFSKEFRARAILSATGEHLEQMRYGQSAREFLTHEKGIAKDRMRFIEEALDLNPNLVVLNHQQLSMLKKDRVVIGFAGPSKAGVNYLAYFTAVENLLSRLDPSKVILASGATTVGLPNIMYEVARAKNEGFLTIGVTAEEAVRYKPAYMNGLFFGGSRFGQESPSLVENIDILVTVGGGRQTRKEALMARQKGLPVINVTNDRIVGEASSLPGRKFKNGFDAGNAILKWMAAGPFEKWKQKRLDEGHQFLPSELLHEAFPGKKFIGFTGWSKNGPDGRESTIRKFIRDFLGELNPTEHVIVTGGTHMGVEKWVHEEAKKKNFEIVGAISQSIIEAKEPLFEHLKAVVVVTREWQAFDIPFVELLDGLVSLGGRSGSNFQIEYARSVGKPVVHMLGNLIDADLYLKLTAEPPSFRRSGTAAAHYLNSKIH